MSERPSITAGLLDDRTAVSSFYSTLKQRFNLRALRVLKAKDLKNPALMQELDLLVLPGVPTEESHYPELVDREALAVIRENGLKKGLAIWLSCAAPSHFAARAVYKSRGKDMPDFKGLGVFSGTAFGPVDSPDFKSSPSDRFADTRILRVVFSGVGGRPEVTGVCYGNGSAYMPAPGEMVEVAARYVDIPDRPIAIAHKKVENGIVSFVSVLPEIALSHTIVGASHAAKFPAVTRLNHDLQPHEAGRAHLLNAIVARWQKNWRQHRPEAGP